MDKGIDVHIFYFLSRGINIVNWITMTSKSAEHPHTIYGNTGQLFRPYQVSSAVYTVISTTGDRTSDHSTETLQLSHLFISHVSDIKSTSHGNCAASLKLINSFLSFYPFLLVLFFWLVPMLNLFSFDRTNTSVIPHREHRRHLLATTSHSFLNKTWHCSHLQQNTFSLNFTMFTVNSKFAPIVCKYQLFFCCFYFKRKILITEKIFTRYTYIYLISSNATISVWKMHLLYFFFEKIYFNVREWRLKDLTT